MCAIYKRCSDKPRSKAGWLSLEWQNREVWGEINALRQKIIFKSSHLYDSKVIQQEAEYTTVQVMWKNPNGSCLCPELSKPSPCVPLASCFMDIKEDSSSATNDFLNTAENSNTRSTPRPFSGAGKPGITQEETFRRLLRRLSLLPASSASHFPEYHNHARLLMCLRIYASTLKTILMWSAE